ISTAYRADVLVADIVGVALQGTAADTQRAQDAAQKFVRDARERRQDGASLTVSLNGKGKLEIVESLAGPQAASKTPPRVTAKLAPQPTNDAAVLLERIALLDRRVAQMEKNLSAVHA